MNQSKENLISTDVNCAQLPSGHSTEKTDSKLECDDCKCDCTCDTCSVRTILEVKKETDDTGKVDRLRTTSERSCDSLRVEELRDAVTNRIRELELDNQRIKAEKNNLRNQLRRLRQCFMSVASTSGNLREPYPLELTKDIIIDDAEITEAIRISLADLSSNEYQSSGSSSPEVLEKNDASEIIRNSLEFSASSSNSDNLHNSSCVLTSRVHNNSASDNVKYSNTDVITQEASLYKSIETPNSISICEPNIPQIPPKVTITRKRFVPSSFRLSYPTSSTSNSSDNYMSFTRSNKTKITSKQTRTSDEIHSSSVELPKFDCITSNQIEFNKRINYSPILTNKVACPDKPSFRRNSISCVHSPDGSETLFDISKEKSSQFLTSSSINLLTEYKPIQTPNNTSSGNKLANRLSGLVNSLSVYTCVKGKARLVQTQSTNDDRGFTDSEDNTSENDFLLATSSVRQTLPTLERSQGNEMRTVESENSMDYYSPPDEVSLSSTNQSEVRSLTNALFPGKRVFKCGPVSELSGKFKLWRQQWAILTSRGLFFYLTKPKENERPIQCITLSDIQSIHRMTTQNTNIQFVSFELVTNKKTHIFCASSSWETNIWIKVLRKAFKRAKAELLVEKYSSQLLHKGFLKRVKCGYSSKVWCLLLGSHIIYYRSNTEINPTGYRNVSACRLQAVGETMKDSDKANESSDSDSDTAEIPSRNRTLALWEENKNPVYFICASDQNYQKWRHYLSLVCAQNTFVDDVSLLTNVVSEKYHNSFYHSRESISTPVSQTLDLSMMSLAIDLFNLLLRVSYPFARTETEIKYERVKLFQEISRMCYTNPGLKDELFLQVIKQSRSPPKEAKQKKSKLSLFCRSPSKSIDFGGRQFNNDKKTLVGMWEGLCILLPLFLPSPPILSFLEIYLISRKDTTTDTGRFAAFCCDTLTRVQEKGGRHDVPSFFEVTAISIRHPYTHQQPFSIPIHLNNDVYHVISFDASTSIEELCLAMHATCFSKESTKGKHGKEEKPFCTFGIYVKGDSSSYLFLDPTWKVCDVISRFEASLLDEDATVNFDEVTIKLHFRIRGFHANIFSLSEITAKFGKSGEEYLRLLVHQLHQDVKRGYYLLCGTDILILVALLCQGEHSDYQKIRYKDVTLSRLVHQHFPASLTDQVEKVIHIKLLLLSRWSGECGRNSADVFVEYITRIEAMCPNHFTASPFLCRCLNGGDVVNSSDWLFLALRFDYLSLINAVTSLNLKSISLQNVVSFGGRGKTFFLVFSDVENGEDILRKLYFVLTDLSTILELTSTLSDYINFR